MVPPRTVVFCKHTASLSLEKDILSKNALVFKFNCAVICIGYLYSAYWNETLMFHSFFLF